jgi:hypothetical protein
MKTFKEVLAETRQFKDPKKDSMVTKAGKTIVIDKSKEAEFLKKGWTLSEVKDKEADLEEAIGSELKNLKKKYKKDLKDYEKNGHFKNDKAEQAFFDFAMANGEVRTDDYEEFEKFMSDVLDGVFVEGTEFVPHDMFDKDGKAHRAKTLDDHNRMAELGYTMDNA